MGFDRGQNDDELRYKRTLMLRYCYVIWKPLTFPPGAKVTHPFTVAEYRQSRNTDCAGVWSFNIL